MSHVDAREGERSRALSFLANLSVAYHLLAQTELRCEGRCQLRAGRSGASRDNIFVCMQPKVLLENTGITTFTVDVAMPYQRKLELRGAIIRAIGAGRDSAIIHEYYISADIIQVVVVVG